MQLSRPHALSVTILDSSAQSPWPTHASPRAVQSNGPLIPAIPSTSPTPTPGQSDRRTPPVSPRRRAHTACQRCRTLKARCDESWPQCSNCRKANTECVKVLLTPDATRNYIESLEKRCTGLQRRLDSILEQRPDRDTDQAMVVPSEKSYMDKPPRSCTSNAPPDIWFSDPSDQSGPSIPPTWTTLTPSYPDMHTTVDQPYTTPMLLPPISKEATKIPTWPWQDSFLYHPDKSVSSTAFHPVNINKSYTNKPLPDMEYPTSKTLGNSQDNDEHRGSRDLDPLTFLPHASVLSEIGLPWVNMESQPDSQKNEGFLRILPETTPSLSTIIQPQCFAS